MAKSETKAEVEERRELTPDEVTAKAQEEEFAAQHDKRVADVADANPMVAESYPVPPTGSYVSYPDHLWGDVVSNHDGHAVQVVQVHTYPNAPTVVTLRCDCSYEWRLTWTGDNAKAVFEATEAERERRQEAGADVV
jgi:hypothetical protein